MSSKEIITMFGEASISSKAYKTPSKEMEIECSETTTW